MAGQIGYKSRAFRGASQILYIRTITPPEPTTDEIDVTHLESPNRQRETIAGFTSFPEATFEGLRVIGDTVQDQIEVDFLAGLRTPETWSYEIADNTTGATLKTFTFSGYIASAISGPIATEEVLGFNVRIKLTSAIVVT